MMSKHLSHTIDTSVYYLLYKISYMSKDIDLVHSSVTSTLNNAFYTALKYIS
jgi:hypothetical protein